MDALSVSVESLKDEIKRLEFKHQQAIQNKWDAKKNGEQKRMEACEKLELINDSCIASLKWALQVIKWHKEEADLEFQLANK